LPDIGESIKKRRLELGLTQNEVADRAGVNISAVSLWESNKRWPEREPLERLLDTLDMELAIRPRVKNAVGKIESLLEEELEYKDVDMIMYVIKSTLERGKEDG